MALLFGYCHNPGGETRGNYQHIRSITADCDGDARTACTGCCRAVNGICLPDRIRTYLFEKGLDKIIKKVGEESTEVIIAAKTQDRRETVYEIADLAYHVMVLMVQMGISMDIIRTELSGRHVIDHKVKQEKMT